MMMHNPWWPGILACIILLYAPTIFAAPSPAIERPLPDVTQEARAYELFATINCVVCQGQSLAESDARLAQDLRMLIRNRIAAGHSDDAITTYLISRYGDDVMLKPPFRGSTAFLWFGPLLLLIVGSLLVWRMTRRSATTS